MYDCFIAGCFTITYSKQKSPNFSHNYYSPSSPFLYHYCMAPSHLLHCLSPESHYLQKQIFIFTITICFLKSVGNSKCILQHSTGKLNSITHKQSRLSRYLKYFLHCNHYASPICTLKFHLILFIWYLASFFLFHAA